MICLDNTDVIEGGASVDAVVDYTIHGLAGATFVQLAAGSLSDVLTAVLYTAGEAISVVSITLVNTHAAAVDVTLRLDPANGGNPRYLIPKTISLGIGYSLHTDGARITVMDRSGNIVTATALAIHAASHTDGTDDVQDATAAQKGVATAAQITKLDAIAALADVTGSNPPQAHTASHTDGSDDIQSATNAQKGLATAAQIAAIEANTAIANTYGVSWDESAGSYARTGSLAGQATSQTLAAALLPIQAAMRRCILNDAGEVQYYLGATDSTKREDGVIASVLTGADGQVMTQIPAFYYKYGYSGTTHTWEISLLPQAGFSLHPAFIKNGAPVEYRYIGAYEGIGWDDSASAYIDNTNVAATGWSGGAIDTAADILSSVSGKNPITDETRAEFRAIAANRGTGWRQQDFDLTSAIQLLYLVEYADWNSQAMIGQGRTQLSGGTWTKDSYIGVTGKSNADGNGTNSVDGNTNAAYMTYRGIENFFGNIWKWVDGINVNDNVPYVSNDDTVFADDTAAGYTALGITLANANGYQVLLEQQARGFLPASADGSGSSSTYITDYYYQAADWRVVRLGGDAAAGADAGVAYWYAYYASAVDSASIGGRLCF